jgi:hypothetical protein
MTWAISIAIGIGAAGALAFAGLYLRTRGWYRSAVGQNLMAMALVIAGLLLLVFVVRVIPDETVRRLLWLGGLLSLDAVLWWRVWLLWKLQRRN